MKKSILFIIFTIWNLLYVAWSVYYLLTLKRDIDPEAEIVPFIILLYVCLYIFGWFNKSKIVYIFIYRLQSGNPSYKAIG